MMILHVMILLPLYNPKPVAQEISRTRARGRKDQRACRDEELGAALRRARGHGAYATLFPFA